MSAAPETEEDEGHTEPHKRANLIGHARAQQQFCDAVSGGRLHHAWLITGPSGVGKATLAYRLGRALLSGRALSTPEALHTPSDDPLFRLVANKAHPDLVTVERPWDEKRKRYMSELPVAEIRKLNGFFARTAGAGGWRVAIIDAADDMNRNAANALLKLLEEPPSRCLILLVCHSPGRLPATVRSRCRRLALGPLSEEETARFLSEEGVCASDKDAAALAEMSGGRPGFALRLAESGGAKLKGDAANFIRAAIERNLSALHKISARYAKVSEDAAYKLFRQILLQSISERVRELTHSAPIKDSASFAEVWRRISSDFAASDALNLDRKQTLLNAAFALADAPKTGR